MTLRSEVLTFNNGQPILMRVSAVRCTWGEARSICVSKQKRGYLAQQKWTHRGWIVLTLKGRQRRPRRCDIS